MHEHIGRVAVVTGASSGIGKEALQTLARSGWRVIGVGRDGARCAAVEAGLRKEAHDVTMIQADLSLLSEVDRLADQIAALTDRVDVLLNNAGGMASGQVMTSEGYEQNFAANHLGPFVLTNRLLPLLEKAATTQPKGAVRIVNTSSDASEMIPAIDLDDLQNLRNWSPGAAYCTGKLANVLHARALAERLKDAGIVAHSYHPGTVDTNFFTHASPETRAYTDGLAKRSLADGADTLVWLATAEEAGRTTGGYWHDRAPREPNALVHDDAFVARFWDASEALVAQRGDA